MSFTPTLPLVGVKDNHTLGSAATYARRYSLAALVGCAPEGEDDDGNIAQGKTKSKTVAGSRKSYPKRKKKETVPSLDPATPARDIGVRQKVATTPSPSLLSQALEIISEVKESDEYLRNKEVDPGDPPTAICERIVSLGADEFRKAIAKSRKEEEAKAIVEEADRVEPLDEKKEDGK